ncbi:solute carrier family 49 member 4-like [Mya arenaria]|uniref:solute carrier family 49 member 4-like n=1 Tax=Mya arenaria TaxID=6604 RepID=UPI0022E7E0B7|nr:solute carrier family 49 member 4-like [Mya arenaria]
MQNDSENTSETRALLQCDQTAVYRIRWMLICSFMVMLSTVVICISMESVYMRWLANLGAWSVGVGETVPLAGPPKVSSTWFPPDQRTSATSLIAFCDYMGVAVSFILDGGLGVLLFVMLLMYFPAQPPRPPSPSAATERTQWISGLRALVRNRAYWLVVVACSTPAGILGVWQSVLNINLSSRGISQKTAGYLGFYQTVAGCIAGLLVGWFSDMFMKRMRITLIVLFTGASMATAWFTLICEKIIPLNYPSLYISCILIGVFINGGIPLFYEVACEASFPVGEGVAGGVLTLVNILVGVLFLAVLFAKNISYDWMNWVLLGSSMLALPLLLCFPERYNRTDLDIAPPHTT